MSYDHDKAVARWAGRGAADGKAALMQHILHEDVRKLMRNQYGYSLSIEDEAGRLTEVLGRLDCQQVMKASVSERTQMIVEAIHGVAPLDYPNNP